jgi:hypothetical protein
MFKKLAVLIVAVGAAATAQAAQNDQHFLVDRGPLQWSKPKPTSAPEIDPASAASAFTLLGAAVVMLRGRRARK